MTYCCLYPFLTGIKILDLHSLNVPLINKCIFCFLNKSDSLQHYVTYAATQLPLLILPFPRSWTGWPACFCGGLFSVYWLAIFLQSLWHCLGFMVSLAWRPFELLVRYIGWWAFFAYYFSQLFTSSSRQSGSRINTSLLGVFSLGVKPTYLMPSLPLLSFTSLSWPCCLALCPQWLLLMLLLLATCFHFFHFPCLSLCFDLAKLCLAYDPLICLSYYLGVSACLQLHPTTFNPTVWPLPLPLV